MQEERRAPSRKLCSFNYNGVIPCGRRVDYILHFNGEEDKHGTSRSCYHHMAGYMLCWQFSKADLPQFTTRVMQ